MLTVRLPPDVKGNIVAALERARNNEIGGVLMGEHTAHNEFTVREITVHRRGTIATFVRQIGEALGGIRAFFGRTGHDYTKFNYLGEWHSHPLFPAEPSSQDDSSMQQIVQDPSVGATFVVLLVLKLDSTGGLTGSAHTYMPNGLKARSLLVF